MNVTLHAPSLMEHNMKSIRVCIENNCGYLGLTHVTFPLILDADIAYSGVAYVSFKTMSQVPGWNWEVVDVVEGEDYVFLPHEYTV